MIIISDTTPIISLIKINRIDLLEQLFQEVFIPEAVYNELTTNSIFANETEIVKNCTFIKTMSVQNHKSVTLLQAVSGLDDGESEAIILADELKPSALIIDERKGRKVAQQLGLNITGTIGILLQAYSEGKITKDEVKLYLDNLKKNNIRLSDSLIQQTLALL